MRGTESNQWPSPRKRGHCRSGQRRTGCSLGEPQNGPTVAQSMLVNTTVPSGVVSPGSFSQTPVPAYVSSAAFIVTVVLLYPTTHSGNIENARKPKRMLPSLCMSAVPLIGTVPARGDFQRPSSGTAPPGRRRLTFLKTTGPTPAQSTQTSRAKAGLEPPMTSDSTIPSILVAFPRVMAELLSI